MGRGLAKIHNKAVKVGKKQNLIFSYGLLAQLVEHLTLNQGVQGSSPWQSTKKLLA